MTLNSDLLKVTERITTRSKDTRQTYLDKINRAAEDGPRRGHLSCSGQAHAYAGAGQDQGRLAEGRAPNLGIVTAYNDMLSAHAPFATYPDLIKRIAREEGATAQVAGGVPAMCDGVTQGETGMELSLFSRDVIALASSVALSHNTFDAALFLGVCDKIVPGLVIAAASFGHIPAVFLPAGPMTSGLSNDEKAKVRTQFATGEVGRKELMAAEMAAYHGPGTCTFYGTANTNQMLMEFMGLHLPGASFVTPHTDLRDALTAEGTRRALAITKDGAAGFIPAGHVLDEKAFVNGLVGLMATGGSTNLVLHLPAMARAAGIILTLEDFADISAIVPLMARVYPNGLADVNHFHAAGGLGYMIGELLEAGLLHPDAKTIMGDLTAYTQEPKLDGDRVRWEPGPRESLNDKILRPASDPFQKTGGLVQLSGNLGKGVIKVSAVDPDRHIIEAPARVFHDQDSVKAAFKAGELEGDMIVVVRFQGPRANGMPELHGLTPTLSVLQQRGQQVALVTDGRMSGASGKVPAAIHVAPEAADGGPIARIRDGDIIRLDADRGTLEVLTEGAMDRPVVQVDLSDNTDGMGRELFETFRRAARPATEGASTLS
ncbi:phosphogluconate dehydratase [Aliiroseovarius sp. F47248L]|uniref:phosphogluconate dehydratase n=1 Tax=Aliiroseovarius sp. F47248L TaxID=2926420 RepID=UPI001FF27906|nr:phosphogluconate dehydratase [Aliiroseovarius sp. F47248L]MCK0138879.1 phosphogluconate dehydratase [Aliiroseovarius sp. F47248L]